MTGQIFYDLMVSKKASSTECRLLDSLSAQFEKFEVARGGTDFTHDEAIAAAHDIPAGLPLCRAPGCK